MKEIPLVEQPEEKLVPTKLEEPKEVVEPLEDLILDFPRLIMSNDKLEDTTEIIEHRKFKNPILPQDNLQKAYEKQLSAHFLKTHNYFENYPLVLQCWKVFQNLITTLHEIKQDPEIRMSYLIMVKKRRRKKRWKALFGITIDRGTSLKLEDKFFFKSGSMMQMDFKIYIKKRENF